MAEVTNENDQSAVNAQAEANKHKIGYNWRVIFQGFSKDFGGTWLPNYVVTIVLSLIWPAIGLIMNTPKAIIIGAAIGLTVAVWFAAVLLIKHVPSPKPKASEQPMVQPDTAKADSPPDAKQTPPLTPTSSRTTEPPAGVLGQVTAPSVTPAVQHPNKEPAVSSNQDKDPKPSTSITQSMVNSPGGIQAGGNVTINQGIPPRRLTREQEAAFVEILKHNPKGSVEISCIESGGPEPCSFARQVAQLLESREAGWTVTFSPIMFGAGDPTKRIPELYILVHDAQNPPARAAVLQHALRSVGYEAVGIGRSDVPKDFVQLTVWFRQQ
jgi:hypothetical protein